MAAQSAASTPALAFGEVPFDSPVRSFNNHIMSTDITTEGKRELEEAVARLHGTLDPQAMRKAREDVNRMREETRQRIGIVDMAVDLIRDARN